MTKVSNEFLVIMFVQAANNNKDLYWVAEQLGISYQAVMQRHKKLRESGVRLPKNPKGKISKERVEKLNRIIDENAHISYTTVTEREDR